MTSSKQTLHRSKSPTDVSSLGQQLILQVCGVIQLEERGRPVKQPPQGLKLNGEVNPIILADGDRETKRSTERCTRKG